MSDHIDEDVKVLHSMGYAQELARRMGGFSNFAISFSIICILAGGITAFPFALSTGGGFSVSMGWVIGGVFALIVAASVGQIASAYPTAGGLYHWSSILGGRGWGWLTAWMNLIGLIFVVASVNFGVYSLTRDILLGGVFGVDVSSWTSAAVGDKGWWIQAVAITVITASQALFNHMGIRVTTILTDFSGYLIFVVAILLTLAMFGYGATHDFSRLFVFTNNTGDLGGGYVPAPTGVFTAFLIGMLYPLYTITGFDASAHTSEETVNARVSVPRGMLHAVFWSLAFGFVMVSSFVLALPDVAAGAKDGANSWNNLFLNLQMPFVLKAILAIGIVVANYLCALAGLTSTSRMIYAFSRDGGLPGSRLLSSVSPVYRTPVAAIWTGAVLATLACYYAPFMFALATGCALFLYISYAMPVAAGLLAEGNTWTEFGPFRLGALSKPFAILTIIGVLLLIYPGTQPPNDVLYAPLFFADHPVLNWLTRPLPVIFALLAIAWIVSESRRFKGPPIGDAIAKRAGEIAAAERAVGEA